jgi:hypothetical protein
MYYTYARVAIHGESRDSVYDGAFFNAKVREFGFNIRDEPNNSPTAGLVCVPVAWLEPVSAKIVWSALSLAAIAFALKLLFELSGVRPSGTVRLLMLTVVFLWHPAYANVAFGQVYFVLLLLCALSMKGFGKGEKALTCDSAGIGDTHPGASPHVGTASLQGPPGFTLSGISACVPEVLCGTGDAMVLGRSHAGAVARRNNRGPVICSPGP